MNQRRTIAPWPVWCVTPWIGYAAVLLSLLSWGCRGKTPAEPSSEGAPPTAVALKLLVIDDEPLADSIRQQWSTRGEGELEIVTATSAEMQIDGARLSGADALVFPTGLLGEMVAREYIVPVPDKFLQDENLDWREVFDLIRLRESTWDGKVMAVPFGSATPLLWYRRDLWQQAGLAPPATWEDLSAAAARLQPAEGSPRLACVEPLAAGWRGRMLLARAAAYAHHRSYLSALFQPDEMRALIAGPPFVRALQELAAMPDARASLELDPQQTLARLAAGEAVAAIGWWAREADLGQLPESAELAVARLPGARQSYNRQRDQWEERAAESGQVALLGFTGRLAAVGRKARSERSAASLLVWLSGVEWSDQVLSVSSATTLYRQRHLAAPDRWLPAAVASRNLGPAFADAVAQTFTSSAFLAAPRLPGEAEYLAALDEAVAVAVRGEQSAESALQAAAAKWDEITDRLGRATQAAADRQSLGL